MKLRDMDTPDLFLPWSMGSQSCESTFRLFRLDVNTFDSGEFYDAGNDNQIVKGPASE